jgi:hypothetical protein
VREVIARPTGRFAFRAPLSLVLLIAVAGLLACTAGPASAENVHVPTQTITGFTGNPFNQPRAVAVDSSSGPHSGDIYVTDNSNARVVRFTAAGEFRVAWGRNVNEGTGDPNICSSAGAPENICKPGTYTFNNSPYGIGNSFSIAVDSTSGPSQGDIYVNTESMIQKFDPTGHLVTSFGGTPFPGAISVGGFESPRIAVDSSGALFVLLGNSLKKYSENGAFLSTVTLPFNAYTGAEGGFAMAPAGDFFAESPGSFGPGPIRKVSSTGVELGRVPAGSMAFHGLAYDPGANELLGVFQQYPVSAVSAFRFNGSGEVIQPGGGTCALGPSGCGASEEFANEGELNSFNGGASGAGVNTIDHTLWIVDTYNNSVRAYKLINVPKVTTGGTENLTRTSVKFLGHVDPDGAGTVSKCLFEYGTTKSYELGNVPCVPATTSVSTDVGAELLAGTLKAQTLYHYRLVAGNANGDRPGADQTVKTLDAVGATTTQPAENVGKITATFKGSYMGDGLDTSFYFEYGPTEEYGQKTVDIDHGTGSGTQSVGFNVTGLYSYYFYHYRLVAHNAFGTTYGADRTFHTEAPDLPTVENTFASEVDQDSARLSAQLDLGEGLTVYRFEYGTTETYGTRTLTDGPLDPEGSNHTATAELSDLSPGALYHFRVIATNFSGTTVGPDETFITPSAPSVDSASATGVTRTSATLGALINPGLSLSTYHFDYGRTAAYGSATPQSAPIGPDNVSHAIGAALSGLSPGTVYHFRAVATNAIGITAGIDQTFTTLPPEEVSPPAAEKCKKHFVRKHGKCVRRKHRRHRRGHH